MATITFPTITNNAQTTLGADHTDAVTTITLATGGVALLGLTGTTNAVITLITAGSYQTNPEVLEIIHVTGDSGDTLTGATRGYDGTSALAFNSGDYVEIRVAKTHIQQLYDALNDTTAELSVGMLTAADDVVISGTSGSTYPLEVTGTASTTGMRLNAGDTDIIQLAFGTPSDTGGTLVRHNYNAGSPVATFGSAHASGSTIIASANFTTALTLDSSQDATFAGDIFTPDGVAGNPAYTFTSDTDSGMYLAGANDVCISAGGVNAMKFASTRIYNNLVMYSISGSAGAPSYSFLSDVDTGMYLKAAAQLSFAVSGTQRFQISASRVYSSLPIRPEDGTAGAPAFSFNNDDDTGMYSVSANRLGLSVGGSIKFDINSTRNQMQSQLYVSKQARHLNQDTLSATLNGAWDIITSPSAVITPTANITITAFDTITTNSNFVLVINQHSTPKTFTWPSTAKWAGGTAPDLTTASAIYVVSFFSHDGTNVTGTVVSDVS